MPAQPLVLDRVSLHRGDRCLFENFSLRMGPGEVVHLTGRNGAGKTSLLEAIAGLRPVEAGSVERPEPAALHWVGHKNGLHPALSAVENLRFWAGLADAAETGIAAALDQLQLKARHRPTRTLSTGQKRRAAIARLLLQPRPWWLLDEPLAGLDIQGVALLGELIARHREQGGAVLLTSHQALPPSAGAVRDVVLA